MTPNRYAPHLRATLALGLPLVGSHLARMAIHVADTVMVGWYGVEELAALVIAVSFFNILFFLGMFAGATLFGRIADRIGRRNVLLLTVGCDAVFGLASVFAPDIWSLMLLRFLTGMAVGGTLPVDYAMMAEFLPPRNRGRWLVWLEGFWAIGTIAIALTAWIAHLAGAAEPWRWIFAVAALPALIGIWLRLWVPESPMYLLRKGDEPGARAVVDRVLTANGARALPQGTRLTAPPVTAGSTMKVRPVVRALKKAPPPSCRVDCADSRRGSSPSSSLSKESQRRRWGRPKPCRLQAAL